mmetsp:Transcript_21499/g.65093  ORF Transcript_21499/g.65093 Transcript_21499/m.65093 type:complete len:248 (-) Transcript_21499:729-1472(-)
MRRFIKRCTQCALQCLQEGYPGTILKLNEARGLTQDVSPRGKCGHRGSHSGPPVCRRIATKPQTSSMSLQEELQESCELRVGLHVPWAFSSMQASPGMRRKPRSLFARTALADLCQAATRTWEVRAAVVQPPDPATDEALGRCRLPAAHAAARSKTQPQLHACNVAGLVARVKLLQDAVGHVCRQPAPALLSRPCLCVWLVVFLEGSTREGVCKAPEVPLRNLALCPKGVACLLVNVVWGPGGVVSG